jgi:hypothetical protein
MCNVTKVIKSSRSGAKPTRAGVLAGLSALLAAGLLVAMLAPLAAGTGDKKGWSVVTDPRKRAFLIWTPAANGPRVLTFGCLRDVDSFTVLSEEDTIGRSTGAATLTVSNGTARFEVAGDVASDSVVGRPTFTGELPGDRKSRRDIAARLLPVLSGRGDILYQIEATADRRDGSKGENAIPTAGLAEPLGRFKSICFSAR